MSPLFALIANFANGVVVPIPTAVPVSVSWLFAKAEPFHLEMKFVERLLIVVLPILPLNVVQLFDERKPGTDALACWPLV